MNGPHDLGGREGFGPIMPEEDEPLFHAEWEKRALGVTLCCAALGYWNIDESRHARESLHPALYYSSSYYEIWTRALEALLLHHGELDESELTHGEMQRPGIRAERQLKPEAVAGVLARGGPVDREPSAEPCFEVGDKVLTNHNHISGHTRLPSYARGKIGTIVARRGFHVFPDSNSRHEGEAPQWLYGVAFDGPTLWGNGAEPGTSVMIDAWESYLQPANTETRNA
ncbi:MAG: nitrile hydratase subunit beta [Cohaesibacter sp.]|jgi:nitrile hydratase|nr:nitrile hydratase subunit beta [Cohaesibacter sp.]